MEKGFTFFTWTFSQPYTKQKVTPLLLHNRLLHHMLCTALLAFQDEREFHSRYRHSHEAVSILPITFLCTTFRNCHSLHHLYKVSFFAPLCINCHSETTSLTHHLLDVISWFEWVFVFPFSHPSVSQRHWMCLFAMREVQCEKIMETRRPLLKATTDVTHRSVTGNWECKINVVQ